MMTAADTPPHVQTTYSIQSAVTTLTYLLPCTLALSAVAMQPGPECHTALRQRQRASSNVEAAAEKLKTQKN